MSARREGESRRWLVPEVIQTSAMDCGPAALAALLAGHGIFASYARLRDACQTDVDGTSIDTLEAVAVALGLDAEQIVIPADHLLVPEAQALPALLVVRLPSGATHFQVVWRRHGSLIQVMDPASGRRWVRGDRLLKDVYVHETVVPAEAWREFADSDDFRHVLARRMLDAGVPRARARAAIERAAADPGWRKLAALDAATRMVAALARAGGVRPGVEAAALVEQAAARDGQELDRYRSAGPAPDDDDGCAQVRIRGAVLVRALGARRAGVRNPARVEEDLGGWLGPRSEADRVAHVGPAVAAVELPGANVGLGLHQVLPEVEVVVATIWIGAIPRRNPQRRSHFLRGRTSPRNIEASSRGWRLTGFLGACKVDDESREPGAVPADRGDLSRRPRAACERAGRLPRAGVRRRR